IYASDGRPDRAVAEMERLEAKAVGPPRFDELAREVALHDGDYRTLWANQLVAQGRADEARRQVERAETAYRLHPDVSDPCDNLGFAYVKLGDRVKAREYFERFLAGESAGERAEQVRRELNALGSR